LIGAPILEAWKQISPAPSFVNGIEVVVKEEQPAVHVHWANPTLPTMLKSANVSNTVRKIFFISFVL
jgi:hypothetical protein